MSRFDENRKLPARGSGSRWDVLWGDPLILEGSEVVIGGNTDLNPKSIVNRELAGRRAIIRQSTYERVKDKYRHALCEVEGEHNLFVCRVADMVRIDASMKKALMYLAQRPAGSQLTRREIIAPYLEALDESPGDPMMAFFDWLSSAEVIHESGLNEDRRRLYQLSRERLDELCSTWRPHDVLEELKPEYAK